MTQPIDPWDEELEARAQQAEREAALAEEEITRMVEAEELRVEEGQARWSETGTSRKP